MFALPQRRRIYLMRHGAVSYFESGRPVPPEGVRLTEEGRSQADAAANALADVPFDAAISSGLPRTDETATIVLGRRKLLVETNPAFQEIRGGQIMGLPPEQLYTTFVGAFTRRLQPDDQFLLGETFGAFRGRVVPALHALLEDRSWTTLLLVAHGATNRVILAELLQGGLENLGHIEQDTACINLIDIDEQGYGIVRLLNYTPYNPLKIGLSLTTMEQYFLDAQERGLSLERRSEGQGQ